jgi:hypothetical protein
MDGPLIARCFERGWMRELAVIPAQAGIQLEAFPLLKSPKRDTGFRRYDECRNSREA